MRNGRRVAWDGACPPEAPNSATGGSVAASETGFSPSHDIGTRRRCLPLTAERPKRHGHARLAHRSTLCRVVAGYHPPHSSQVSHQRATLKPSTLGESGWASRVARASQMHTKCPGTRFGHFGAARETSPGRIATPRGPCRSRAPRRGTRDLGIDSRLVRAVFIRIWARSCIDRPPSPRP